MTHLGHTYLTIPVESQALAASLHLPPTASSEDPAPVVICCHGLVGTRYGSSYRSVDLARRLATVGIACLRFDFRGCGESTGRFQDLTLETTTNDLLAVVAALHTLDGCDADRIGIVASSFSAMTTSHAAAHLSGVKCLVFLAPVADADELIRRDMTPEAWDFLRAKGWVDHFALRLGAGFFESVQDRKGPHILAASPTPLRIYHGSGDQHVPFEHGKAYAAAVEATSIPTELISLNTSDHGMRTMAAQEQILAGTIEWMRRFLAEPKNG